LSDEYAPKTILVSAAAGETAAPANTIAKDGTMAMRAARAGSRKNFAVVFFMLRSGFPKMGGLLTVISDDAAITIYFLLMIFAGI
jgi:hypothetical protein